MYACVSVVCLCLYQTAELEQSRRTSSVIIVSGRVSMGTGAPLPPQVFVVVDSMKTLVDVSLGAVSVVSPSRLRTSQRLDQVHLVLEKHKAPAEPHRSFRVDKHTILLLCLCSSQRLKIPIWLCLFLLSTSFDTGMSFL